MTTKIVLSYRRADSDVITGRIRDTLARRFGEDAVFMDIDNIPFGYDYREQIKDALLKNKLFIAVIGPKWLGGRGKDARINDEADPVRIEVETALQQGTPVIPVLIGGAAMPKPSDLPPSLQNLPYLNAAEVDGGRDFHQHMDRLIRAIDQILQISEPPPPVPPASTKQAAPAEPAPSPTPGPAPSRKWTFAAGGAIACLLLIAIGIWVYPSIVSYIKSRPVPGGHTATGPAGPAPEAAKPPPFTSADCKPKTAAFYDDFHKADLGWNFAPGEQMRYADGQLVLTPQPNRALSPKYLSLRYANATVCAHIKSPPQVKAASGGSAGGVIFWAVDSSNYYMAETTPDGDYSIYRRVAGAWTTIVAHTKNQQVKTDLNAVNELSVALVDDFAAIFINNAKVAEFRGQPPNGGGAVGLYAQAESSVSDEWRFLDIAVMDNGKSKPIVLPPAPTGPTLSQCRPANSTDFRDTFTKPDPGWGFNTTIAHYADGQLSLKPGVNKYYVALYRPLLYATATACVTVKSPLEFSDVNEIMSGGLAFWASDHQNLYAAAIYPNGTFTVLRKVSDQWVTVAARTASDAIKQGGGAVNQVQVVLSGGNGTLYINGTQVRQFRGQPPAGGGATGLYAASERGQQNEWRFLDITVVANQ